MPRTAAELSNVVFDHVGDSDVILDAVVLLRVASVEGDGHPRLIMQTSPDLDWLLHTGMLQAALQVALNDIGDSND